MGRFAKFNPKVCFLFFVFEIILSLVLFNPIYLVISLLSALLYGIKLQGVRMIKMFFAFIIPLTLLSTVFNMLFAHYGDTVLFTVFSQNFNLEPLFYGFCRGMMFSSVIMWILCYSFVISSDKFLSVFSRFAPNISLVFSMTLSFIPRLRKNANEINEARSLVDTSQSKIKKSIANFSALISMTLEESIEVSDSMHARGFNKNRKAYSKYAFCPTDGAALALEIILSFTVFAFCIAGKTEFIYEPVIDGGEFCVPAFIMFTAISFLPIIIDLGEDMKWLYLKRKI